VEGIFADSPIETRDEIGKGPNAVFQFWMQQLKLSEREQRSFIQRGRRIVSRYRASRPQSGKQNARFNILWSNVETLKPILYGRTPKPDVSQRYRNDDPVSRLGAEILQRALGYEDDMDEFTEEMLRVVEDKLLPGRGVARVFYEADFGEPEDDPDAEPDEDGNTPQFSPVEGERAPVRYVFWEDYRESPARTWREVWWVGFRAYKTRDELVSRFGPKIGKAVTLDYTPKGLGEDALEGPQADAFKKAEVWEVWDKRRQEVVWIAPSYTEGPLDKKPDPLRLPGFFPSPRPLLATTTNDTQIPVADYIEYQDQAIELDILTARIDKLTQALQVKGLYAGTAKAEIQQLITDETENRMIPVEDWQAYVDKGGLANMIMWMPVEQIAKVLIQLYDARDRVLRTLYQITGMADILRGETDPNETLGAQQLKSQFATRRLTQQQKDVARFARDLMRLRAHVMAQHFSPETLGKMSGLPNPLPALPDPPPMMVPAPPPQPMPQPQGGPMMGHNGGPPMAVGQ